ncbi:MAG: hypothetical protein QOF26_1679 [Baekduia sp.]|nr:hypothetical protein [Baekduia sp.]
MRPIAVVVAGALLAVTVIVGALAAPARAQAVDETCALALTKLDQGTTNVLYPDDSARYYIGAFAAVPGTEIRLVGRFPRARYASYNVYDAALRPVDALADAELLPDAGSSNPFLPGADRTATARGYTARISFAAPPSLREPNTMYAAGGSSGVPNPTGVFAYRIYIPDDGQDEYGGVGLPTAAVVQAGSGAPVPPSVCAQVRKPELTAINDQLAQVPSAPTAEPSATATGRNPPHWRKFVNVASSVGQAFTDNPAFNGAGQAQLDTLGGSGGFLSNRHNAYLSALLNRGFGQVLVTRLRVPAFPDTRHGAAVMPAGQVRYWSLCQNDPLTERVVACLNDDRVVAGPDGFATFVVSTPNERPANATTRCGVNWLPWGPDVRGALIYRNMLPAASFAAAIQRAEPDAEPQTMGDGFPVSAYYADAGAFDALPCARAATPAAVAPAAPSGAASSSPGAAPACSSHRRFTLRLPRGTRSVTIDGRRQPFRGRQVVIDLRGRPRSSVVVRIHRPHGATIVHRYRVCVRRR